MERECPDRHPVARGGDAHEFAPVRAPGDKAGPHLVAFGNLVLDLYPDVGKGVPEKGDELLQPPGTPHLSQEVGLVEDEVEGNDLVRRVQVPLLKSSS